MILIIDTNRKENTLAFDEFVLPIANIVKTSCKTKHYTTITKKDIDSADKIIISGTTLKDNDVLNNIDLFEWLKKTTKPVLGICAGMHIIGKVFGCELQTITEIGLGKITTIKENPLFSGTFEAYQLHGLVIKPNNEFDILASSEKCIQAIKHKEKQLYGVLFHPEVRNSEIIQNFLSIP